MPYPSKDLFATQDEALAKARVLGCYIDDTSFHTHTENDEMFYMPCKTHEEYEDKSGMRSEQRSEHISVPEYVQENAKRGLDNLDLAGDGLVDRTISEARALAMRFLEKSGSEVCFITPSFHISRISSSILESYVVNS